MKIGIGLIAEIKGIVLALKINAAHSEEFVLQKTSMVCYKKLIIMKMTHYSHRAILYMIIAHQTLSLYVGLIVIVLV